MGNLQKRKRNRSFTILAWLVGIAFYVIVLRDVRYMRQFTHFWAVFPVCLVIAYALSIIWKYVFYGGDRRRLGRILLRRFYMFSMTVGLFVFASKEICVALQPEPKKITVTQAEIERIILDKKEELISNNLDKMQGLLPENYEQLSDEEKLSQLYILLAVEAEHLGIQAPKLEAKKMIKNLHGYTSAKNQSIVVNESILGQEWDIIETILHEIYHAYQIACIEQVEISGNLLWEKEIKEWKEEYEKGERIVQGDDEAYTEYYTLTCEESARLYSEERIQLYEDCLGISKSRE